ncbi:MAG TPA: hypothetical protein VK672_07650 [Solirubrobacteraceae bacterium]|jgi:hypothetical protein|nr:hypothetical protein [Solirubrobacteraceae bacterium]
MTGYPREFGVRAGNVNDWRRRGLLVASPVLSGLRRRGAESSTQPARETFSGFASPDHREGQLALVCVRSID